MRLLQYYMSLSSPDDDSSIFRSIKIGITENDTNYDDAVRRLSEKYSYVLEALDLVDTMNENLHRYRDDDNLKYRLCIDEDINVSKLGLNLAAKKPLMFLNHDINDKLVAIKDRFEKDIGKR